MRPIHSCPPPDAVQEKMSKGLKSQKDGKFDDAKKTFLEVIEDTSNCTSDVHWNIRGKAYFSVNEYYEAIRCFDEAMRDNKDFLDPLLNKALTLRKLGKYYESLEALNEYRSHHPDSNKIKNVTGIVYDDLGFYDKAVEIFKEVIDATKDDNRHEAKDLRITALNNMAMSYTNAGEYRKARETIKEIRKEPREKQKQSFILDTEAYLLLKEGHASEAEKKLREATEYGSDDKFIWYHLGNAYSKMGKTHQALLNYQNAIKIDEGFAEAYNDMAAELSKSHRYDEAKEALKEALRIKPDLVTAHENLIKMSLRHHINPTFWDFWTASKYRKVSGTAIFVLITVLIAFPLLFSLGPIPIEILTKNQNASALADEFPFIDKAKLESLIPVRNLIAAGILALILLSPTIKTAKVGALEFSFLDSQRSVQPLANV